MSAPKWNIAMLAGATSSFEIARWWDPPEHDATEHDATEHDATEHDATEHDATVTMARRT
jgi:hypothetical protein